MLYLSTYQRYQKKALEKAESWKVVISANPYKVDGEVGRFEFATYSVLRGDVPKYNTAADLFSQLKGKQYYRTIGFKEIAMIYGDTEKSYCKTSELINRIRYQIEGGTPYRRLQENTEKEGSNLIDYVEEKTKRILMENGFTEDGLFQEDNVAYANQQVTISRDRITEAAGKCLDSEIGDETLSNPVCYEHPENTVNISIDDVIVKKQEEIRQKGDNPEGTKRKYVHNTVAHVSKGD